MEQAARLGINGVMLLQLPLNISIVHAHAFSNEYWKTLIHESYQRVQKIFKKISLKNLVGLAMGTVVFRSLAREAATVRLHLQAFKKRMVRVLQRASSSLEPLSISRALIQMCM
jgi:hypothetical protein